MAASKQTLNSWFDRGIHQGSEYMIVVCDTFDYSDYPVYCMDADFYDVYHRHHNKNMQRIMEVYNLGMSREDQMGEYRAFHYPPGFDLQHQESK